MAGTTSPYSLAGTSLMANVEALIPVLITQVYKPGHPVYYSVGPSVTDMKTGHDLYYRAEKMIFKTVGNQMGKFYNLPISGEAGGTLTYRPDVQNGAESTAYLMASIAGGQNIIGGIGSCHNANGMSAEQIIMQCGLADMVEFFSRGIKTDAKHIGFEAIERVGVGGNFLTDELTLDLLRSDEFFERPFLDLSGGYHENSPGMYEIAHNKAEELCANYTSTVPSDVREAIQRFFYDRYQDEQTKAIRSYPKNLNKITIQPNCSMAKKLLR